jgi:RND family efflux transporter MFP subunit
MKRWFTVPWLAVLLAGCGANSKTAVEAARPVAPIPVAVGTAEARRVDRSAAVTGSLAPDETVTVSSEVAGRVAAIHADFGQSVSKGQVLAQLDRREFEIQLERSRASLHQALARLGLPPDHGAEPPQSTPAIRQAEAQLEDARFKYENAARLVKTGDVSQERFTELEKVYRARQAVVDAARDELRTNWMSVEALRAEVKLAEKRLADTTLRAPFDASVTQRHVSPGQYVDRNMPVLTLVKAWPLRLRLEVPEQDSALVQPGSTLEFTTDAVPGRTFRAVVRELSPSLDSRSRQLLVEARLAESDPRLRPGLFVQVRLLLERDVEVVVVPKAAVYTVAGLTKVFVIRDGKAVERRVPPGRAIGGGVEVPPDQVKPGDQVALDKLGLLYDGAPVAAARRS